MKAKSKTKPILFLFVSAIVFVAICIGTFFLFIKFNEIFAANVADQILRPTIGNQATVAIESFFFSLEDTMNGFFYKTGWIKPRASITQPKKINKIVNEDDKYILTPITSLHFFPLLPNEGKWIPIDIGTAATVMAETFVRPDPTRSYAIVTLVKMNMDSLNASAAAGTWEPAEIWRKGQGMIPLPIQQSNLLVAAFNGGFQKKDGAYGMIVGNTTYLPLQYGLATIVLYSNSKPQMVEYTGQFLGENISVIRQNGPLILKDKKIVTSLYDSTMKVWGLTTTNSMYTWRSGLGITKNHNLIYAAGPSLVPETLAKALQSAGAVSAMQLDINPVWVRFITYHSLGNGRYLYTPLLDSMVNGGLDYLRGYQKDFFYIYKKQ